MFGIWSNKKSNKLIIPSAEKFASDFIKKSRPSAFLSRNFVPHLQGSFSKPVVTSSCFSLRGWAKLPSVLLILCLRFCGRK